MKLPSSLKPLLRPLPFVAAITLCYALCFTLADFSDAPFKSAGDLLIQVLQWGTVAAATFALLWLLSASRIVFAICFPILTTLCAAAAYFRYTSGVSLTPMAIDLAIVNDMRTSLDVVTWQLIVAMLAALALAVWAAWIRCKRVKFDPWWLHTALPAALLLAFTGISALQRPVMARLPFNLGASVCTYLVEHETASESRPAFSGKAACGNDSMTVVLIIGETLRAANMQINGYQRPTTPLLCRESNVVSMRNIYSEFGFTHKSVPYILTRADHDHIDRMYDERSFIDIFKKAGYHTAWIANQENIKTFTYFMKEADTLAYVNSGKSLYIFDQWLDGDVLPVLDAQLRQGHKRQLLILHTIGSHWWYNSHYPRQFARWKPELESRVLSANSREEFINSYDNSVLYSDYFWNEVRNRLRGLNAIVIYLSDHGENLGENGIFGHGQDAPPLHYPGCWIWMSNKYLARHPSKAAALRANRGKPYNSSFLFHSIIDAGDITTQWADPSDDVFHLTTTGHAAKN